MTIQNAEQSNSNAEAVVSRSQYEDVFDAICSVSYSDALAKVSGWTDFPDLRSEINERLTRVDPATTYGQRSYTGPLKDETLEDDIAYGAFVLGWRAAFNIAGRALGIDSAFLEHVLADLPVGQDTPRLTPKNLEALRALGAAPPLVKGGDLAAWVPLFAPLKEAMES